MISLDNKTFVIGVAGKAEVGKSTFARCLGERIQAPVLSFSTPLKAMLEVLGVSKGHPKFRFMAQTLGTEWGRNIVNADIWVNFMAQTIRASSYTVVIIDDVRFQNEVDFVRHNGVLYALTRDVASIAESEHVSETSLNLDAAVDIELNMPTLIDMNNRVEMEAQYLCR